MDKSFAKHMLEYYDGFIESIASSIDKIAEIQEKFKKDYNKWQEIKNNPTNIITKLDDLTDEDRRKLLDLLLHLATIDNRLSKLFDLTAKEKKKLANDLRKIQEKFDKE